MQLHRSLRDKAIAGVCSGIAETLQIPTIYIRLIFLLFLLSFGHTLLVYLILWLILPEIDVEIQIEDNRQFFRSHKNQIVGGVCGGLAELFNADPSIVRLVFVVLGLFGSGIVFYLILWLITPSEPIS